MTKTTPIPPVGTVNISTEYFEQLRQQASEAEMIQHELEEILEEIITGINMGRYTQKLAEIEQAQYAITEQEESELWKQACEEITILVNREKLKNLIRKNMPQTAKALIDRGIRDTEEWARIKMELEG